MGWGGAWGRVRVRCPRVAQFRLFCPFPLRFPAGHPFWPPILKALYTHWWATTHRPLLVPGMFVSTRTPSSQAAAAVRRAWRLQRFVCWMCSNFTRFPKAQQSANLLQKLEAYHSWALTEPRIGGFCPWHYLCQQGRRRRSGRRVRHEAGRGGVPSGVGEAQGDRRVYRERYESRTYFRTYGKKQITRSFQVSYSPQIWVCIDVNIMYHRLCLQPPAMPPALPPAPTLPLAPAVRLWHWLFLASASSLLGLHTRARAATGPAPHPDRAPLRRPHARRLLLLPAV